MIRLLRDYDMEPGAAVEVASVETIGVAEKLAKKMLVYGGTFTSIKIIGESEPEQWQGLPKKVEKVIFYDPEQGTFDLYDSIRHKIFSFIQFSLFV